MFKYLLEGAGDINWMAIFALITFFFIFLVSTVVVFMKNPAYIEKMANMPLEDNQPITTETTGHEK